MSDIGGWLVAGHEARPDERVVWSGAAMRVGRDGGTVGGKLFLTTDRVLFSPHRVESLFGSQPWEAERTAVVAVRADDGDDRPGGRAHRFGDGVRLELDGGATELFLVLDREEALGRLEADAD